jgi:hypothetical protein
VVFGAALSASAATTIIRPQTFGPICATAGIGSIDDASVCATVTDDFNYTTGTYSDVQVTQCTIEHTPLLYSGKATCSIVHNANMTSMTVNFQGRWVTGIQSRWINLTNTVVHGGSMIGHGGVWSATIY